VLGLIADVERDFAIRAGRLPEELLFKFAAGRGIAVVVKSNETGCVYGVGCAWVSGLIDPGDVG
jgi:hypothetical protein